MTTKRPVIVSFAGAASAQSIAFTFDDGPVMTDSAGLNAAQQNEVILRQLAEAHVKSFLFVSRTDSDKRRRGNSIFTGIHQTISGWVPVIRSTRCNAADKVWPSNGLSGIANAPTIKLSRCVTANSP